MIEIMSGKANESLNESYERIHTILQDFPKEITSAWRDVISRAKSKAKTTAAVEASRVYHITPSDIMRKRYASNVKLRTQAQNGGVIGEIRYSGYRIPLIRFNVSPKRPTPKESQHVVAAILRGSAPSRLENAFIAKVKQGHTGVFERQHGKYMDKRDGKTKHSQAIGYNKHGIPAADQFYGLSMPEMVGNAKAMDKIEAAMIETIEDRTIQNINRILNGYGMK